MSAVGARKSQTYHQGGELFVSFVAEPRGHDPHSAFSLALPFYEDQQTQTCALLLYTTDAACTSGPQQTQRPFLNFCPTGLGWCYPAW